MIRQINDKTETKDFRIYIKFKFINISIFFKNLHIFLNKTPRLSDYDII